MAVDDFLDHLQRQAGEALRVATWYTAEDFGMIYTRADLDREAVYRRAQSLSNRLMATDGHDQTNFMDELGEELAMVQVREDAVIVRFPLRNQKGVVVSMDIDVATDLHSFISECAEMLEDESISFRSSAIS